MSRNGSKNSTRSLPRVLAARRWAPHKNFFRRGGMTKPIPSDPTSSPFAFPSFQFRLRLSLSLPLSSPRLFYPLLSFLFRPPSVPALLGSRSRCSFHSSPFPSELFDAIKKPEKEIYKMMSRCARLIRRCRGRGGEGWRGERGSSSFKKST